MILLPIVPRNMLTKDEIKVRVLKLKNELLHEPEPVMYKDLADKYLNKVLDILDEYRS
jgi:hypothetical protein